MFAVAPLPIFSTVAGMGHPSTSTPAWDFRPAVPSALSSSPIRASLSPLDENALPRVRDVLSSPPQPTTTTPKFRFAAQATRRNPVVRRREDAQESRRNLFLRNVRQRAEDSAWGRRDVENKLLKSDWQSEVRRLEESRWAAADSIPVDEVIEDEISAPNNHEMVMEDKDDMLVDVIAQQEELEMDAMISSYLAESQQTAYAPPTSPIFSLSDDEDYDQLFMDIVLSQPESEGIVSSQQMDMS